jgi:hypothetical protein
MINTTSTYKQLQQIFSLLCKHVVKELNKGTADLICHSLVASVIFIIVIVGVAENIGVE